LGGVAGWITPFPAGAIAVLDAALTGFAVTCAAGFESGFTGTAALAGATTFFEAADFEATGEIGETGKTGGAFAAAIFAGDEAEEAFAAGT